MNITLHQLKALKSVHEIGSVTKAAKKLFMTQPAVSNLLKALEERVGGELFFKVGRSLSLTNKAELLIAFYEKVEAGYEELIQKLEEESEGIAGRLKIGCVTTAKYLLPRLLHDYKAEYPLVKIEVDIVNKKSLINKLRDKEIDCAVLSHPPNTFEVTKKQLVRDKLVVIGNFDDFKNKKMYSLEELRNMPWLIREVGSGTRMSMLACFEKNQFQPKETTQVNDTESIKQLVIAGFGISMVPESSVKSEIQSQSIVILNVKELEFEHNWFLTSLPTHPNRKLIENFEQTASKLKDT